VRWLSVAALAVAFAFGPTREARAQGFISPFIGSNFGGNVGCRGSGRAGPGIACQDGTLNVGGAVGAMWDLLGFEEEVAYRSNFLGNAPSVGLSSSVVTFMSNAMLAPKIGSVRPYVLGGIGLIHARIMTGISAPKDVGNDGGGWDVGGGVMGFFGERVGVRGDIRYIRAFQTPVGTLPNDANIDYGPRISFGLILKF
jgi:hypothetical protein